MSASSNTIIGAFPPKFKSEAFHSARPDRADRNARLRASREADRRHVGAFDKERGPIRSAFNENVDDAVRKVRGFCKNLRQHASDLGGLPWHLDDDRASCGKCRRERSGRQNDRRVPGNDDPRYAHRLPQDDRKASRSRLHGATRFGSRHRRPVAQLARGAVNLKCGFAPNLSILEREDVYQWIAIPLDRQSHLVEHFGSHFDIMCPGRASKGAARGVDGGPCSRAAIIRIIADAFVGRRIDGDAEARRRNERAIDPILGRISRHLKVLSMT
ncbi:hypothetical protein ACVMB3_004481 [Sinorhizobium meliloti]